MRLVRSVLAEAPLAWLCSPCRWRRGCTSAARVAAAGLRAGLRGDRAACRPAGRFDREAGGPGRRGHRRLPQRHARQCRGADHRPGRPARGHARRRQGIAGRFDHRQPMLVLGAAFLAGGLKHPVQTFATIGARTQVGMLALAAMAILVPSAFAVAGGGKFVAQSVTFSIVVSVILLAVYGSAWCSRWAPTPSCSRVRRGSRRPRCTAKPGRWP